MQGKTIIIVAEKYFRGATDALEKRGKPVIVKNIKREILECEVKSALAELNKIKTAGTEGIEREMLAAFEAYLFLSNFVKERNK